MLKICNECEEILEYVGDLIPEGEDHRVWMNRPKVVVCINSKCRNFLFLTLNS